MPRFLSSVLVTVFLWILISHPCSGQDNYASLQSAYMYNFAKYIKWNSISDPFIIGIYGSAAISEELAKLSAGKKINGKNIVIKTDLTLEEVESCNIVYLSKSKSKEFQKVHSIIDKKEIILVSENDLSSQGACISFINSQNKLRFKINMKALKSTGLEASEGLLKLAIIVE